MERGQFNIDYSASLIGRKALRPLLHDSENEKPTEREPALSAASDSATAFAIFVNSAVNLA